MTGDMLKPNLFTEKPYRISNICASIRILLNYDRTNYDAWEELFETQCCGFGVTNHLSPLMDQTSSNTEECERIDAIVKCWIYNTLSPSLYLLLSFRCL